MNIHHPVYSLPNRRDMSKNTAFFSSYGDKVAFRVIAYIIGANLGCFCGVNEENTVVYFSR